MVILLAGVVDNIFVGQLGSTELAAVSLGNSFVFIGMLELDFQLLSRQLLLLSLTARKIEKVEEALFKTD